MHETLTAILDLGDLAVGDALRINDGAFCREAQVDHVGRYRRISAAAAPLDVDVWMVDGSGRAQRYLLVDDHDMGDGFTSIAIMRCGSDGKAISPELARPVALDRITASRPAR